MKIKSNLNIKFPMNEALSKGKTLKEEDLHEKYLEDKKKNNLQTLKILFSKKTDKHNTNSEKKNSEMRFQIQNAVDSSCDSFSGESSHHKSNFGGIEFKNTEHSKKYSKKKYSKKFCSFHLKNLRKQVSKKVILPTSLVKLPNNRSTFMLRSSYFQLPKQYTDINDSNMEKNLDFWRELRFKIPKKVLKYRITNRLNKLATPKNQKSEEQLKFHAPKTKRMSRLRWKMHRKYLNNFLARPRKIPQQANIKIERGKKVHIKYLIKAINRLSMPRVVFDRKLKTSLSTIPQKPYRRKHITTYKTPKRIKELAKPKSYKNLYIDSKTNPQKPTSNQYISQVRLLYLATPKKDLRKEHLEKEENYLKERKMNERKYIIRRQSAYKKEKNNPDEEVSNQNQEKYIEIYNELEKLEKFVKENRLIYHKEYQRYKKKLRSAYNLMHCLHFSKLSENE